MKVLQNLPIVLASHCPRRDSVVFPPCDDPIPHPPSPTHPGAHPRRGDASSRLLHLTEIKSNEIISNVDGAPQTLIPSVCKRRTFFFPRTLVHNNDIDLNRLECAMKREKKLVHSLLYGSLCLERQSSVREEMERKS